MLIWQCWRRPRSSVVFHFAARIVRHRRHANPRGARPRGGFALIIRRESEQCACDDLDEVERGFLRGGHNSAGDADAKLASELMKVLQKFSHEQHNGETQDYTQVTGRRRRRPKQHPEHKSLADQLLATLNVAVAKKWSDSQVASAIIGMVQPYCTNSVDKSVGGQCSAHPGGAGKPEKHVTWQPHVAEQGEPETPRRSPPVGRHVGLKPEVTDMSGGRAKQRERNQPPAAAAANGCAKKLLDGQWNEKPSPMSIGQVRKAVQEGKDLPGNVVCTDKPEMLAELRDLWQAHAMQTPCTVAVVVPESGQGVRTVSVWWQPSRVPALVRIKVHQLATKPGPIPKEPINAKISSIKSPSKCTVRILAPEQYRRIYSANGAQDKPEMVISELASKAGIQAALLTGGTWERLTHKQSSVLVGHLRMPCDVAEKLEKISGHRGLFACRLQKSPQQAVAWAKKVKDEDDETYFRRVQGLASAQKKPMAFRQGGGSDLGVCGGVHEAETKPKIRTWVLHWAPDTWTQVQVEEFLKAQGWTDVTMQTRRKAWKRREPHQ